MYPPYMNYSKGNIHTQDPNKENSEPNTNHYHCKSPTIRKTSQAKENTYSTSTRTNKIQKQKHSDIPNHNKGRQPYSTNRQLHFPITDRYKRATNTGYMLDKTNKMEKTT